MVATPKVRRIAKLTSHRLKLDRMHRIGTLIELVRVNTKRWTMDMHKMTGDQQSFFQGMMDDLGIKPEQLITADQIPPAVTEMPPGLAPLEQVSFEQPKEVSNEPQ